MSDFNLDTIDIHTPELYLERGYPFAEWDFMRKEAPIFWYERDEIAPFWSLCAVRLNSIREKLTLGFMCLATKVAVAVLHPTSAARNNSTGCGAVLWPPVEMGRSVASWWPVSVNDLQPAPDPTADSWYAFTLRLRLGTRKQCTPQRLNASIV